MRYGIRHLLANEVPPCRCRPLKSVLVIISHRHRQLPIVPPILVSKLSRHPPATPPDMPYSPGRPRPPILLQRYRLHLPNPSPYHHRISQISHHITVHGMMQHWQSSPHQHCFGPGGLPIVRIVLLLPLELPETLEVVLGGMVFVVFEI